MPLNFPEEYIDEAFTPEVKNIINLTMAFTAAVGNILEDGQNLVVSPYNAMACLSMVAKGAEGETREQLARTLFNVSGTELDAEVAKYKALNDRILETNKDQVTLATANGVWANSLVTNLDENFTNDLKASLDAEISNDDFSDSATLDKINGWANENTRGLIQKVLDEISATAPAIMASSLYFKGDWTYKFDKEKTEDKSYKTDDGQHHLTAMMHHDLEEDMVSYQENDDYAAISMTFGKADWQEGLRPTMRLILVRPNDDTVSARDWLASQVNGNLPVWMVPEAYSSSVVGQIEVPHMDMEESYTLNGPLQEIGIRDAFGANADFSPMTGSDNDFYLDWVKHDVVFKADEDGAEAAAITSAGFECLSVAPPPQQIDFKLNRSYVLVLQDVETGAPLFIGAVNKPNEDMKPQPTICPLPM